jgi:hypothetical protein
MVGSWGMDSLDTVSNPRDWISVCALIISALEDLRVILRLGSNSLSCNRASRRCWRYSLGPIILSRLACFLYFIFSTFLARE